MTDITSIGEILIDLTQTGVNEQNVGIFAANPGGAPANVAAAAARLGARAASTHHPLQANGWCVFVLSICQSFNRQ